jgi:hypothetical protein
MIVPMAQKADKGASSTAAISQWENEGGSSRKHAAAPKGARPEVKAVPDMTTSNVTKPKGPKLTVAQRSARKRRQMGGK